MSFFPKQNASRVGTTQTVAYDASIGATNAFGAETYQLPGGPMAAGLFCCGLEAAAANTGQA